MGPNGCVCTQGWVGVDCSLSCGACSPAHGLCVVSNDTLVIPATGPGGSIIQTYDPLASTVLCLCTVDADGVVWTGNNCDAPCPCGPSALDGATHGACSTALSADRQSAVSTCSCDDGWIGQDCGSPCPACSQHGTCMLPAGYLSFLGALGLEPGSSGPPGPGLAARLNVTAVCQCDNSTSNALLGRGYTGDDCSVACAPCSVGTCTSPDGFCTCLTGYVGSVCDKPCNGNGLIVYPVRLVFFLAWTQWAAAAGNQGMNYYALSSPTRLVAGVQLDLQRLRL